MMRIFIAFCALNVFVTLADNPFEFRYTAPEHDSIGKRAPDNYVYHTENATLVVQCAYHCQKDALCQAYNFVAKSGACQLVDKRVTNDDLLDDINSRYLTRDAYILEKSAFSVCATSSPCKHGTCLDSIDINGNDAYHCLCEHGYEGQNCETFSGEPEWGPWGDLSDCSVSCGLGYQYSDRVCQNSFTKVELSERECFGSSRHFQECVMKECPSWSNWSVWSDCSSNTTCGQGVQYRERTCERGGRVGVDPGCTGVTRDMVYCYSPECGGGVYLANDGTDDISYGQGRVMIYDGETWGQVCNAGWGQEDAEVVCRQVGLAGVYEVPTANEYGAGHEQYYMYGLECNGNESSIQQCTHSGWTKVEDCTAVGGTGPAAVKCAVNGSWNKWSEWGPCSVTCAEGIQKRTRDCTHPPPMRGGRPCLTGSAMEERPCTGVPCPVDAVWQPWGEWTQCNVTCGGGMRDRYRTCTEPLHNGRNCDGIHSGAGRQTEVCNDKPCPVDGYWGNWENWGNCSVECGGGDQTRLRQCIEPEHGGTPCEAENGQTDADSRVCNTQDCPVDAYWKQWSYWSRCDRTCGSGTQFRTRECVPAKHGGENCTQEDNYEEKPCNTQFCPVDGIWQPWESWNTCNVTCGGGYQYRVRECTGPFYGGVDCVDGPDSDSMQWQECNTNPCPIDGHWLSWLAWSECTVTCGGGEQTRMRICQAAQFGGVECLGHDDGGDREDRSCNHEHCPVDGYWLDWHEWSSCSVSCGDGIKDRFRDCVPPQYQGRECSGDSSESIACHDIHCPIDGKWDVWQSWGPCSTTCDNGTRSRERDCIIPQYNGRPCRGGLTRDTETEPCFERFCPGRGQWLEWGPWSACGQTCGGGLITRTRLCNLPEPDDCLGNSTDHDLCARFSCNSMRSCHDLYEAGLTAKTSVIIDPDGEKGPVQPFPVECLFQDDVGWTIVQNDLVPDTKYDDQEKCGGRYPGPYSLTYTASISQLIALADVSSDCFQFVNWKCYNANFRSMMNPQERVTYLVNRHYQVMDYWGGATPGSHSCACGVKNSCEDKTQTCNCDVNQEKDLEDGGNITHKADLPITQYCIGDTGGTKEWGFITIGPLYCSGQV